jgi:hypothetical protein
LTQELGDLVMLLQAAIEIANVERWALALGDEPPPPNLQQKLRTSAYEVTVVDVLHRVGRRFFDQQGWRAVWERQFPTGKPGRPEAVDLSFFSAQEPVETRLELGLYTKAKLQADSQKLARLDEDKLEGFETTANLLLLWKVVSERLTEQVTIDAIHEFKKDSQAVSADQAWTVTPLLASSIDLFSAGEGTARYATVGIFRLEVHD